MSQRAIEDIHTLAPLQEGLLFQCLAAPDDGIYVLQDTFVIQGPLPVAVFEGAWQRVVARHTMLRAAFSWAHSPRPLQIVFRDPVLTIAREDWSHLSDPEQQVRLESVLEADRRTSFDLTQPPLMRMTLCRLGSDRQRFIWTTHHLLLDGWSKWLIFKEVVACCEAALLDQAPDLEPPHPFSEYVAWLQRQDLPGAERFWRTQLASFTTPTPLPLAAPSPAQPAGPPYAQWTARLDETATAQLRRLAASHRLTLNTLFQGAWALLLSRYGRRRDVVFGTVVSVRPGDLPGVESMVGVFINTLPVRVLVDPSAAVVAWLRPRQDAQASARRYDFSPLIQVQTWSGVPRGTPLFDTIVAFDNYPVDRSLKLRNGIRILEARAEERVASPLALTIAPGDATEVRLQYDARRFEPTAVGRMLQHYPAILDAIRVDPDRRLWELTILDEDERRAVRVTATEWGTAAAAAAAEAGQACVHELFETQARRTPDSPAVASGAELLTYQGLNRRANQLARRLRAAGAGPEVPVAIALDRSLELVIAVLAVLKAGAAYVPLDLSAPGDRLAFILADTGARLVLTRASTARLLPSDVQPLLVEEMVDEPDGGDGGDGGDGDDPRSGVTPANLAYILYTSGSTGRPKGVAVAHRELVNYLCWAVPAYRLADGSGAPLHSSLAFDLTVTSLFTPWLAGRKLDVLPESLAVDSLADALRAGRGYSLVKLTPAHLDLLRHQLAPEELGQCAGVMVIGGENLTAEATAPWRAFAPGTALVNEYGPTETVVGCCAFTLPSQMPAGTAVPIGRPIAGARIHLLDADLEPVPPGIPGELYVGGPGVARGYLNRPALTADRFLPDPFSGEPGARLYRTGDLARLREDGDLEFLGRVDTQVKIRGHRVEPGEIEAQLGQHPAVKQAAVVAKEDDGVRRLYAYVVLEPGEPSEPGELVLFLRDRLPDPMIPAAVIALDALPLTPNGKVDRVALATGAVAARARAAGAALPLTTSTERRLAAIWREVLAVESVGRDDDFFSLGGDSLLLVRLVARIQRDFGVDLALKSVIETPSMARLAERIDVAAGLGRAPEPWSPVVTLQRLGAEPPFFCAHPINGQVLCYFPLAGCMVPDHPLIALQAGDEVRWIDETSVEEMAGEYVAAVRAIQPEGPYRVGGWSLGGVIAFEMAHQLRRQGADVALVAMIDSRLPWGGGDPHDEEDAYAAVLKLFPGALTYELRERLKASERPAGLPMGSRLAEVRGELHAAGLLPEDTPLAWIRRMQLGYGARMRAVRRYRPRLYDGRITLFRGKEPLDEGERAKLTPEERRLLDDPAFGWGSFSREPVDVVLVPGDHDSMVGEPNVAVLAERLRECLDRVAAPASG